MPGGRGIGMKDEACPQTLPAGGMAASLLWLFRYQAYSLRPGRKMSDCHMLRTRWSVVNPVRWLDIRVHHVYVHGERCSPAVGAAKIIIQGRPPMPVLR